MPAQEDYTRYSPKRMNDRVIDELIGISRGITADSIVNQQEAEFLFTWLDQNRKFINDPVIELLYNRLSMMLLDNILDDDEAQDLLQLLEEIHGKQTEENEVALSAIFPLDDPAPAVVVPDHKFCLTGTFAYGPREFCSELITTRGGRVSKSVTLQTDYLVIGNLCTDAWIHSSYGRKIEKAMDYRDQRRTGIQIIHEDHWVRFVGA